MYLGERLEVLTARVWEGALARVTTPVCWDRIAIISLLHTQHCQVKLAKKPGGTLRFATCDIANSFLRNNTQAKTEIWYRPWARVNLSIQNQALLRSNPKPRRQHNVALFLHSLQDCCFMPVLLGLPAAASAVRCDRGARPDNEAWNHEAASTGACTRAGFASETSRSQATTRPPRRR